MAIMDGKKVQMEESLCGVCRSVSLHEMRSTDPNHLCMQRHQPSYLALKQSTLKGCMLCKFIWTALEQDESPGNPGKALAHVSERYPGKAIYLVAAGDGPESWLDRIQIISDSDIPEVSDAEYEMGIFDPTMHPDHQVSLGGVLDIYAFPDDPAAWYAGVRGRPLPSSPGDSEEDFALAEYWLNDCLRNHASCIKNTEVRLPTRVVDVGDGFREPSLLETAEGSVGCYITLSHCWGGHVPLVSTTQNLDAHKKSLPLSSMPPTFRDSVVITRRLGIQYIWIDSLCILQDSKDDWEKESAVMGDVYGRSFLTIAARGAANSTVGCFITRPAQPPSCPIPYRSVDDPTICGTIYVRDPAFRMELVKDSPLDKRGWVFQERILSSRNLYYGTQQLYWECGESTARQDGKYPDISVDSRRLSADSKRAMSLHNATRMRYHGVQPAWDERRLELTAAVGRWYLSIEEYTKRSLTYSSDRLPAIAGIAKQFHKSTGYLYVAGLWQEDIILGLLWHRVKSSHSPPTSDKLPSWSWARFDGAIRFFANAGSGLLRVPDGSCEFKHLTYRAGDALGNYGEVLDAAITLCGRIISVRYGPHATGSHEHYAYSLDGIQVGWIAFDTPPRPGMGGMSCLLVTGMERSSANAVGLLLETVPGKGNTYRRIGYVTIDTTTEITEDGVQAPAEGRVPFWATEPQVLSIE